MCSLSEASFRPFASFSSVGDHVRFLAEPDTYFAERINDLLTAYVSFETKEIIGGQIKGIEGLPPALHNYFFNRGKARLDLIAIAVAAQIKSPVDQNRFQQFLDVAEKFDEEVILNRWAGV